MRHQFDLNLFAEAPAASTDPAPEAEQMPPEEAQPEQEPEAAKKYTDADVDAIINRKFAKWQAEKEQAVADAQEEAAKLAKMNGEQRRQYEAKKKDQRITDLEAKIEEYKKAALRTELSKSAARILKEDHQILATQDMLDFVVGDDAESSPANIVKLTGIIQDDRKLQEEKRAAGRVPKAYAGGGEPRSEIQKRIDKFKRS